MCYKIRASTEKDTRERALSSEHTEKARGFSAPKEDADAAALASGTGFLAALRRLLARFSEDGAPARRNAAVEEKASRDKREAEQVY